MSQFRPELRPLAPSALPLIDPERAWAFVFQHTPHLPGWPRLPRRSFLEAPTIQLCEGFPGVIFENDHIYIDEVWERDTLLDKLYIAYLADDFDYGQISPEYAACLGMLIADSKQDAHPVSVFSLPAASTGDRTPPLLAAKGQIVGPLTWAAETLDGEGRPILYNDELPDIVAKHLRLKAGWQERVLHRMTPTSLVLIEEPLLAVGGIDSLPFGRDRCASLVQDTLGGLAGLRGVCCPYPADSIVLNLPINVLSLDVSDLAGPDERGLETLRTFVGRGGFVIWAIVPADRSLAGLTTDELVARLLAWLEAVAPDEEQRARLAGMSMVAIAGNLAEVEEWRAEQSLGLVADLSHAARVACGFEK